jgi:ribosomal protein L11 methyltransferase
VTVADRLVVRPPWIAAPAASAGAVEVVIDPGQAFGTGAHPSTRLCLELLLGLAPGGALLDLGCGSGVLAIAAARLGWAPVLAADHDPAAVRATATNAAANRVAVEVARADLRRDPLPAAATVVANLVRGLLLAHAERLAAPPERLVAGGLLVGEADEVACAYARRGLAEAARRDDGEWAALLLKRR